MATPSPIFKTLLALAKVDKPQPVKKSSFLYFLGTDTFLILKPTKDQAGLTALAQKSYERGETLSYHALAVAKWLDEEQQDGLIPKERLKEGAQKNYSGLAFKTDSVALLNGPDTFGSNVGYRITEALFIVFEDLLKGKTDFQISAHSRGAVEAILLIHELNMVKKELEENINKPLYEILNGLGPYAKKTFINKENYSITESDKTVKEINQRLLEALQKLKVNAFLIDPVPGDSMLIGWNDQRFYKELPEFVVNKDLLIYRDERTDGFYPIVPKDVKPLIIPGHHGTGSGNRYCQQMTTPNACKDKDTTAVQDLLLYKLWKLSLPLLSQQNATVLNLEHEDLDRLTNAFLSLAKTEQNKLILESYRKILQNNGAYQAFTQTRYAYLGSSQAKNGMRYIHYRNQGYQDLGIIGAQNEGFINHEHALLFLRDYIQLDNLDRSSIQDLANFITDAIRKVVDALSVADDYKLNDDDNDKKLLKLLKNDSGAENFFNALGSIVDILEKNI